MIKMNKTRGGVKFYKNRSKGGLRSCKEQEETKMDKKKNKPTRNIKISKESQRWSLRMSKM